MKYILLIILSAIPWIGKSQEYCDFIQNIQNYQNTVRLESNGDNDILDSTTFDINKYLSFFSHVEIDSAYKIDVFFLDNFFDGNPYLYALKENGTINCTKDKNALYTFLNLAENRAKNHIIPKDIEIGFLQFLFFSEMGEQFALKWHSNYNEKYVICEKGMLERIIKVFKEYNAPQTGKDEIEVSEFQVDLHELESLESINPSIKINLTSNYCTITWIENRTHSGIFRVMYRIERQSPYEIEKLREEQLLEITTGFLY